MRQTLFDARDISIYHIYIYIYIYCPLCVRTSCFERGTYDICVCVCERERDKDRDRERQRETEWQADRWTDRQSDFSFYFANKWYSKFIGCMYHCAQTDCGMDLEPKCVGLKVYSLFTQMVPVYFHKSVNGYCTMCFYYIEWFEGTELVVSVPLLTWTTFNPKMHRIHDRVLGEITYPFPNFNGCTVEVWEWTSNFIPHLAEHVITYLC